MRFAILAPCHDARSLTPVRAASDPTDVDVVLLPSRQHDHDDEAQCQAAAASAETIDDMLGELAWYGPWDGVLVVLGGTRRRGGRRSDDAKLLARRVRRILGPDVPVGTVDDAHHDIAAQLGDGLNVLRTLRAIAVDPAAGQAGA